MNSLVKIIILVVASQNAIAQNVGIGTNTPDASAKLEVSSVTQGMLVPRMNSVQRNAILSPTAGLLVFDTDTNTFWYFISGFGWSNLSMANSGWQLTGNSGTDTSVNFIGSIDNRPLKFKVNNQRAGLIGVNGNIFLSPGSGTNSSFVSDNIAIGTNALNKNTNSGTVAIGASSLGSNTSGDENTAVGDFALEANTTGSFNTAFGNHSLYANITGGSNTALGADVLGNHLRGNRNTAVGTNAMFDDTTGFENTAIGYFGLFNNLNGFRNTALGSQALYLNTIGSNNLGLGYKAETLYDSLQNASAIGALARVDCSNCLVLGSVNGVNGASSNINVGIGTTYPKIPLSFPAVLGKKISLYPGTLGDAGFGVYGNELRMHSDYLGADITFGFDDYTLGFKERMRIKNAGDEGMELNGRIFMKNGTSPLDINYGPGVWLSKADNSGSLGFMGTQNNQNIGFYGGTGGWGFTYDAVNSRVGIGTNAPVYTLEVVGNLSRTGNFVNTATSINNTGLVGRCNNTPGFGRGVTAAGGIEGIYSEAILAGTGNRYGLFALGSNGAGSNYGIFGIGSGGSQAIGILGDAYGATTNWAGYFTGNVFATGTFSSSDRKLKKDSKPLSGALSIINKLNPSVYKFKTDEYKHMHLPEGVHYGLMADELELVMPGIVKKAVQPAQYENNEPTGKMLIDTIEFHAVNYTEIIPVLISAIKEQQVMIEELKIKLIDAIKPREANRDRSIINMQQQIDKLTRIVEELNKK